MGVGGSVCECCWVGIDGYVHVVHAQVWVVRGGVDGYMHVVGAY